MLLCRASRGRYSSSGQTPVGKHSFNPPQVRINVHRALAHPNHVGKSPPCFIEELLSSSSVQFRRDPGVLVRVYDFLFGRRGLSTMHFSPMTVDERLAEAESLDCSTEDYSPSVKAAPAKKPVEWSDIQDAVAGFIQYTVEYCDPVSVRVGLALVPFVSSMQTGGTWPKRHLQTLVFWINSQLLAYRDLAHTDVIHGTHSRDAALQWFSVTHPSLQQLRSMLIVRAMDELAGSGLRPSAAGEVGPGQPKRPAGKKSVDRKTPVDVVAAIPRDESNRELCLKFASRVGCRGKVPGKCNFGDRGHFVPGTLPEVVRRHII